MPKLRVLSPRIKAAPHAVRNLSQVAPDRKARRKPWAHLYADARWSKLRISTFRRAGWVCEKTGVPLVGRHPAPNSPVCDHKVPHRGNVALFFDPDNLQAVSKAYHDSEKQKLERSAMNAWGGGLNPKNPPG